MHAQFLIQFLANTSVDGSVHGFCVLIHMHIQWHFGESATKQLTPSKRSVIRHSSVDALSPSNEEQKRKEFDEFVAREAQRRGLNDQQRQVMAESLMEYEMNLQHRKEELQASVSELKLQAEAIAARERQEETGHDDECCVIATSTREDRWNARQATAATTGHTVKPARVSLGVQVNLSEYSKPIDLTVDSDGEECNNNSRVERASVKMEFNVKTEPQDFVQLKQEVPTAVKSEFDTNESKEYEQAFRVMSASQVSDIQGSDGMFDDVGGLPSLENPDSNNSTVSVTGLPSLESLANNMAEIEPTQNPMKGASLQVFCRKLDNREVH